MARLTVGPIRLSYAFLFEPRPAQAPGQKQKYGASLIIPKTAKETLAAISKAIADTKAEYKAANPKAAWIDNAVTTLYNGDGTRPKGEPFGDECKGAMVLGTSTHKRPMVVDADKQPILDAALVYSGCYGLAVVNFYVYDTAGNKGIACSLDGFMKTADGPALSGYTVSNKDWDNVAANDLAALQAIME